jgi:hypothetical protein
MRPWRDRRVRLAANHAVDKQASDEAKTLGRWRITGNIMPPMFAGAPDSEPPAYAPRRAMALLREARLPLRSTLPSRPRRLAVRSVCSAELSSNRAVWPLLAVFTTIIHKEAQQKKSLNGFTNKISCL